MINEKTRHYLLTWYQARFPPAVFFSLLYPLFLYHTRCHADLLHPATTVANIKLAIPLVLDYEGISYSNWATLFKLHCRANLVLEHIEPPSLDSAKVSPPTDSEKAIWQCLDDIVRQWIYETIVTDLLNSIISSDDTTAKGWSRLESLFLDNKTTRACQLDA